MKIKRIILSLILGILVFGANVYAVSSNANLSNLGTKKYDFTGFSSEETNYDITVPESYTEVEVYAETQDKDATYTVSGDKNLKRGTNTVTITVTASDGVTKKEYYINVRRLGDPAIDEKEEKERQEAERKAQEEAAAAAAAEEDRSSITAYSEPHTQKGWIIIGISLAVVAILLVVFIIIDDYKPEKKSKKDKRKNKNEEENNEEDSKQECGNEDSQATKILKIDEIKTMKDKHF